MSSVLLKNLWGSIRQYAPTLPQFPMRLRELQRFTLQTLTFGLVLVTGVASLLDFWPAPRLIGVRILFTVLLGLYLFDLQRPNPWTRFGLVLITALYPLYEILAGLPPAEILPWFSVSLIIAGFGFSPRQLSLFFTGMMLTLLLLPLETESTLQQWGNGFALLVTTFTLVFFASFLSRVQLRELRAQQKSLERITSERDNLLASGEIGIWSWENDRFLWDATTLKLFRREAPPRSRAEFFELLHEKDRERVKALIAANQETTEFEFRIKGFPESYVLLSKGRTIRDEHGQMLWREGTTQDISKLRQTEAALDQSQALNQEILESIEDGLIVVNANRQRVAINRKIMELTGFTREELLTLSPTETYWPQQEQERLTHELNRVFQHGQRVQFETLYRRKDGTLFPVLLSASAIFDEQNKPLYSVALIHDLTSARAEEQIRQSLEIKAISQSKLAQIGELAAIMAHEINTPLAHVQMVLDSFQMQLQKEVLEPDRFCSKLAAAGKQVQRIKQIIDHMRLYARAESAEREFIPLETLLNNAMILIEGRLRLHRVHLTRELAPDLPLLHVNPTQLEQALLNLINNALDALEGTERKEILLQAHADAQHLYLDIQDNGSGMAPETLQQLFTPFFTTKPAGMGTGLGLSITQSIITEHGGHIGCHSVLQQGTTFSITLPVPASA